MDIRVNGLAFHVDRQGEGPPLLLLHGFTGSTETWRACRGALARRWATCAIDLVGHGRTEAPMALDHYRMPTALDDLAALLDALDLPATALLGYSMGGRVALQFAAAFPQRVTALVLEGASPGIADPGERAARIADDEALAARIERDGVPAFVDRWERQPLFRSQERLPVAVRAAQRAQRLRNTAQGLANSLRGMGAGAQEPVWEALAGLTMPALLIAGADDAKYGAIARQMAARLPAASVIVAPDAGHAAHLEQPEAFADFTLAFLGSGHEEGRADRDTREGEER